MIRVLAIASDFDGVGYFRSLMPHFTITDPEIRVDVRFAQDGTLPLLDERFLSQYNILVYNKVLPFFDMSPVDPAMSKRRADTEQMYLTLIKKHNIKVVYDIDDYWILNNSHPNYKGWKQARSQETLEKVMKYADVVTTTTPLFAEHIKKVNPSVVVLPNAVNPKEQQWDYTRKYSSERIRFMWCGGISHAVDIALLKDEFKKIGKDKDFLEKAQFVMCGFDMRMRLHDGDMIKDDLRRSAWGKFESIFSNNWSYVTNVSYKDFLWKATNFDNDMNYGRKEEFLDNFYQRRNTRPILTYAEHYRECEVSLAPLKNNHMFNYMKSQLKFIEAGAYKCPVIASNFGPYTIDDLEGKLDGKQKGFLIDESTGNWYEKMRWYFDNPSAIEDHGNNLYEYIMTNYSIDVVNKKRIQLYKDLAKGEKSEIYE